MPKTRKTTYIARTGIIAALYAALTLLTVMFLQVLAWGPVQFRVSEAVCIMPVLSSAGVPGLTIGCFLANLISIALNGTGLMGLLDVGFGTLATFLGALWTRRFRKRPNIALLGPVLTNALIVPLYLPLMLMGYGYYTIPFTEISLDGAYLPMYLFGCVAMAFGEGLVVYVLGKPLLKVLQRFDLFADEEDGMTELDAGDAKSEE